MYSMKMMRHPRRRESAAVIVACCCLMATTLRISRVESFSPAPHIRIRYNNNLANVERTTEASTSVRRLFEEYMDDGEYEFNPGSPKDGDRESQTLRTDYYAMGGVDLSKRWAELVAGGHVTATTELKSDGDEAGLRVRYGVRLDEGGEGEKDQRLLEFAEVLSSDGDCDDAEMMERVASINATLTEMQQQQRSGTAIKAVYDGPYTVQLQLVRTLRPPRSKEMSGGGGARESDATEGGKCTCQPPPYDPSADSFLVGPLRLHGDGEFHGGGAPRERAARFLVPGGEAGESASNCWDCFHNISPVDPRGHFLLLPDIEDERQWRDQSLNAKDCRDLTYLASTIEPAGSMVLSFNSVSAGASQNHIHAHCWLDPPPPLLYRKDAAGWNNYAAKTAKSLTSLKLAHGMTASLLKYPCTCVKLSATLPNECVGEDETCSIILKEIGAALSKIVGVAQKMLIPHNVVWTNGASQDQQTIDVYTFFRKSETIEVNGEMFRLGSSEMLGVFHASSPEQLMSIKNYKGLFSYGCGNILGDISYDPNQHVWAEVSAAMGVKRNRRLAALQKAEMYKKKSDAVETETPADSRYVRTGVPYPDEDEAKA